MSLALYRKYRSRSLDEVVGQEHVTELLKKAIARDKIVHAYLFTGPKGVGKTSIARIIAHAINDVPYSDDANHLDIIEIDAASNNGVDDIRDLRERVQTAPSVSKKKIYIIDEVHMLSKAAFNALLKTLEEPPEHVVFILATTDIDKVPDTILSRTQRHTFRRASTEGIVRNLTRILNSEHVQFEAEALETIALHSNGSYRDSVSLLDQLLSGLDQDESLSRHYAISSLGLADADTITALLSAVQSAQVLEVRAHLDRLNERGIPARTVAEQLIAHINTHHADDAQLLSLIDTLLEVSRSTHPDLKLLTTLGLYARPSIEPVATTPLPVVMSAKAAGPTVDLPQTAKPSTVTTAKSAPKKESSAEKELPHPTVKKKADPSVAPADFDWQQLVAYVRTHHVAIHSVLAKCEPVFEDNTLTLYTRSAFYKKKLDDVKYRVLLNDSLTALGMNDILIETVPTTLPLKDSDAAKVAAIMGGGEEVSVESE